MNKGWRRREFRDMVRERRQRIWRVWALLGGDRNDAVGLGEISYG